MTYLEKFMAENPEADESFIVEACCPTNQDGSKAKCDACMDIEAPTPKLCEKCWNRDIEEDNIEGKFTIAIPRNEKSVEVTEELLEGLRNGINTEISSAIKSKVNNIQMSLYEELGIASPNKEIPHILDSGNRREFGTGAVRDIQEGKGRCDLMPLDVVAAYIESDNESIDWILYCISEYQKYGQEHFLYSALYTFRQKRGWDDSTMLLEEAKHFEEGAKKYGENNWQKGIPTHCYIDSAVRHYLKHLRGDTDEPHDRAFCWNLLCCIWTCKHKPELNDYAKKD